MFQTKRVPLDSNSSGWNGEFNGKRVEKGVYVYLTEILLPDGRVIVKMGDVTVI